jgi:iron only hydrogenase large subunit-like protein
MSHILSAEALNDFISPGVACIKPVELLPTAPDASLEHEVIREGQDTSQITGPAKISLTDCLACSGCVTSAEAVLVSLQSHAEVLDTLDAAPGLRVHSGGGVASPSHSDDGSGKIFVASVAPQTRASLAAACGENVSERQAGHMLERLLMGEEGLRSGGRHGNGFTWVVDTNTAREASLVLGSDEVLNHGVGAPSKPILAASCPGWVCYAEKTHPHVLGHLSKVKSPQALMGTLLKTVLSRKFGIPPSRIWHLAIMPCFDKKLEASREELTDGAWMEQTGSSKAVRDVDCVITSKEVLMLAESRGLDFFGLSRSPVRQPPFPDTTLQKFLFSRRRAEKPAREAGSSGGNLHFVLQDVLSRNPGSTLQSARGRNADVVEYVVISAAGEPIFKAARYYGFRNIQNLVRRLKPAQPSRMPGGKPWGSATRRPAAKAGGASLDYAYVEVMACPSGCNNGGGQIKVDDPIIVDRRNLGGKSGPPDHKWWLAQVDEAYFSAEESDGDFEDEAGMNGVKVAGAVDGISPSYIRDTLAYWAGMTGIDRDRLVYTTYREVVSDVGKSKAGDEAVIQLAGKIGGGW